MSYRSRAMRTGSTSVAIVARRVTISSSIHLIAVVLAPFGAMSIPAPLAVGARSGALRRAYAVGLALAARLTLASFGVVGNQFLWAPVLPVVLIVLAIAQVGGHFVCFLHSSTGPTAAT